MLLVSVEGFLVVPSQFFQWHLQHLFSSYDGMTLCSLVGVDGDEVRDEMKMIERNADNLSALRTLPIIRTKEVLCM